MQVVPAAQLEDPVPFFFQGRLLIACDDLFPYYRMDKEVLSCSRLQGAVSLSRSFKLWLAR